MICFALFKAYQLGAHAQGKFVYLNPRALGGYKVPELVSEDDELEQKDSDNDEPYRC